MIVYSKKIVQFIHEIKYVVQTLLSYEIRLKVTRDRFYNRHETACYPIKIVIYNNKSLLGYFDPGFYELGFHERLMHSPKEELLNVIRHELAHYITFINHGEHIQAHGAEFRAFCQQMGWSEEVSRATSCPDGGQDISTTEESAVLRKVQKLMALAGSNNQNEAELAMVKSQQLLLKHNIDTKYIGSENEEKMVLKRILKQKKENAKMSAIAFILETFFVNIVFHRGGGFTYLEILGSAVNVEIAEYVADFLQRELDLLWNEAQRHSHVRGIIAKNSFFLGLARGYCNKIQALKRDYASDVTTALMVIEKKLSDAKSMAYQRLSSTKSRGNYCPTSSALGEHMGKQLNINPALNRSSSTSEIQIAYHS